MCWCGGGEEDVPTVEKAATTEKRLCTRASATWGASRAPTFVPALALAVATAPARMVVAVAVLRRSMEEVAGKGRESARAEAGELRAAAEVGGRREEK